MIEYKIILIILLSIAFVKVYYNYYIQRKRENFPRFNPVFYNDIDRNILIKTGIIKRNIKLDKYGRIENSNFNLPKIELGEQKCYTVNCPHWIKTGICWKCD